MEQLFINGKIWQGETFSSAMAVRDGKIVWLGDSPEEKADDIIDLQGKTVLPSFWDIHTHPLWISETLAGVPCTPPNVNSIAEMIDALKQSKPALNGWIEGWGYDESKLAEGRTPTIHDLDQVSATQPVYVLRSDCHSCAVNSAALRLAGITKDTPDPVGGKIGRFPDGEPNGVMIENGASQLIKNVKSQGTFEEIVANTLHLGEHYRKRGIGVISDMISLLHPFDFADIYSEACRQGLPQKVYLYYSWDELRQAGYKQLPKSSHPQVEVAGIKLFMDGTISNQTAHMKRPFKNSQSTGFTINDRSDLESAYEFAKANHCQIAIHAMGDASIQLILDTLGDKDPWLEIPSVRIEHATLLDEELLADFAKAKMNFAFVTQIIFLYAEYASYSQNLEEQCLKTAYPLKSMLESGVPTALSSDAPATAWMAPDDVFTSLTAAVTRKGANDEDFNSDEAISLEAALRLYTSHAAAVVPGETIGVLTVDQPADFLVLDQDIFTLSPEQWPSIQVEKMYLQGKSV